MQKSPVTATRGPFTVETGRLATQADGAALVRYGDTRVLVTVTRANADHIPFFPLSVDYEERFYAGGKIPGGFFKREGRPSEQAVLTCRMIDRPLRPLFTEGYHQQVQIVATVLSATSSEPPEIAAMLGASTALMLSQAPFQGPIAGVRMALIDGEFVTHPTEEQQEQSAIDVVIAGTKHAVTMVEGRMDEIPEEQVVECIQVAHEAIKELVALQEDLLGQVEVKKLEIEESEDLSALESALRAQVGTQLEAMRQPMIKHAREELVDGIGEAAVEAVLAQQGQGLSDDEIEELKKKAEKLFDKLVKEYVRKSTLASRIRFDGRRPDDLREVSCEVGLLPRVHGSALFQRGETQSLGTCTLGTTRQDEQIIDLMLEEGRERFMLHYNFPPYSVGEVGRIGTPKRREIGHGYLAKNALRAVLPSEEDFPYSIRLVSEILESNGSSSMATVCSGSLALMDAGVPIKKPVAGIAMGLIEEDGDYVVLTDIAGYEDHFGDMDFKVAGTRDGITSFQLDVKVSGITPELMREAMAQAKRARLQILDVMEATIAEPRAELSRYAPRIQLVKIDPEKIGMIIGPGGKTVRAIQADTDTEIEISEEGVVKIAGVTPESIEAAEQRIKELTAEVEPGQRYTGKVVRVERYGAFVEFKGGSKGLIRKEDLGDNVQVAVSVGDEMEIEVSEIDEMGRVNLRPAGSGGGGGGGRRGGDRREPAPAAPPAEVGDVQPGTIKTVKEYGAFVRTDTGMEGLIHISEMSDEFVKNVTDVVNEGDRVTVELTKVESDNRGRPRYSFKLIRKGE